MQYGNAGGYTITPKGQSADNYEISFVAGTLTVDQKEVGLEWSTTPLTFNGTAQAPMATATGMLNGDAVSITVSGAQTDAGTDYTATVSGLTGDKADNYKLPDAKTTIFSIDKAAAQTLENVTVNQAYTLTSISASVAGAMPSGAGALTYNAGTAGTSGSAVVPGFQVDTEGKVTSVLTGGAVGDAITLPVTIGSTNYADSTVNVAVTLKAKDDAGVSISDPPPIPLEYCDVLALTGSVQNPGTNGTWTWTRRAPEVLRIRPNGADAEIEALNAGTATIMASYESDTTIGSSTTVLITVNPKPLTITANNQNILVHDELPAQDDYQVEGFLNQDALMTAPTLVYQKNGEVVTPDNTAAGTYDIVPFGANAGNNYTISYVNGTLTISEKNVQIITAEAVSATFGDTGKSVSASVTEPATGGGAISYAVKRGSEGCIDIDPSTGALTIKQAGTAAMVVTAAETAAYAAATKEVAVTIDKANSAAATIAAKSLIYNGTEMQLMTVDDSTLNGGTMQYALGTETAATQSYTTSIPTATEAGTYYVWYKAVGDKNHNDSVPASVPVTISAVDTDIPTGLTATYGQTLADVTLPEGWTWVDSNVSVGNVGTNVFKANYTPTDAGHNPRENADVSVTVGKAASPAAVADTAEVLSGYKKIDLADCVKLNGEFGAVSYAIIGEDYECELSGSVLTSGYPKETVTVKVGVTVAEDENYKALEEKTIAVTIKTILVTGVTLNPTTATVTEE